ncbi:MAG: molybdopterin molybdenumtransferase MoeA, partial [Bacteroidota bacterium]
MISVVEADKIISENLISLDTERIPSLEANGRILKEAISADRDFPPFDRVMMDGIAIRLSDWQAGQRKFRIQATQLAGVAAAPLMEGAYAIEIMTGAVCPPGADCIIRVEDLDIQEEAGHRYAYIRAIDLKPGQNIHQKGLDRRAGEILLSAGIRLGLAELAVAVSVGKTELLVTRIP